MTGVFGPYRIEPATIPASAHFTFDGGINLGGEVASYVFAKAKSGVFLTVRVRRQPLSFRLTRDAQAPLADIPADADDLGSRVAAQVAKHVRETGRLPASVTYPLGGRPRRRRSA